MTRYVLCVDGGGIRGIIPSLVLAEIEKRTKKTISKIFDLMVGTSTGAIVVAGLCKKDERGNPQYSPDDLVELYRNYGSYIFKTSSFRQLRSWFNCALYSHEHIEFVLDKYFGDDILENTSTNLLITSYDIHNNTPFFFKSYRKDKNFLKLKDVLRAATAAPTFFVPKYLQMNETDRVFVDGAVFANNPSACGYASSKVLFPNDKIVMLSIGTGNKSRIIPYYTLKKYGKVDWLLPILNLMFNSSLTAIDYQLNKVLGDRYIRIQSPLKLASSRLDNTKPENIESLKQEALLMINNNKGLIDEFCNIVS